MPEQLNVLIMGATYGSLLAAKLALANHNTRLVCLPAEAELINQDGLHTRMPIRGQEGLVDIRSTQAPGQVSACGPDEADPAQYDLVVLAMQEPQYRLPGVRDLLDRVALSGTPCMSIMNMPPLPYLSRLPGIDPEQMHHCYADAGVWKNFDPALITLASPDPQAFRPPDSPANLLQVSLPTNFKVANFQSDAHTAMLRVIEHSIADIRFPTEQGPIELPVKLRVHDSVFVPLAKWSMLLTGNYRCITAAGARPICEAVHDDIEASRSIYAWVGEVCQALGATGDDLVPFEKYAAAAQGLAKPSSAARALYAGAPFIERVDLLVHTIATGLGMQNDILDQTVSLVDAQLAQNRAAS